VIAREVVGSVRATCQLIAETPGEIGTARPEIMAGVRSFSIPPLVLLFRYSDSAVQVVRVLHERQDIERSFSG
jgi:toxin ParE1/3/4